MTLLIWTASAAFAASWFMPVLEDVPGWMAFRYALSPLLPYGGVLYADYDPQADSTALFRSDCTVAGACRLMPDTRMFEGPGRISNLVTSPDLAWIAAGWPAADQFLFFKSAPRRLGKVDAVSNVTGEFSPGAGVGAFPIILGWSQPAP